MAKDVQTPDPLAWLHSALEGHLADVGASVEHQYSGNDRGSLTVYRDGKVMQTSYFASWEMQALRDGGNSVLEKQKAAIIEQINRLLNPPKPQPISLVSLAPAKRGRQAGAKKPEAAAAEAPEAGEAAEAPDAIEPTAEAAEPADAVEVTEEV